MLVGYARVSTVDQNLDLQISTLNEVGCEKIYQDQLSGTRVSRPGLEMALEVLRKNDSLVVWKLDRLGRTVKGLMIWLTNYIRRASTLRVLPIILIHLHQQAASFSMSWQA